MSDSNLTSGSRIAGEYAHDAIIVRVAHTKERRDASVRSIIDQLKARRASGKTLQLSELAAIEPGLTEIHELDHYRVLQSTPFGLLLWRLWQCLAVNVSFVEHQIAAYAPDATRSGNCDILGSLADQVLAKMPPSTEREYLLYVVFESRTYLQVIEWLMDGRDVTVGRFVDEMNLAFQFLATRSEMELDSIPTWTSRRPRDSPLLSNADFTAIELLEAGARAREMILLDSMSAADDAIEAWRRPRMKGHYVAAFQPLIRQLGEPSWIRVLVDVAFSGDSDLTAAGPELLAEDTLPALRANRLVESLRSTVIRNTLEGSHAEVSITFAQKAGLEPPRDVYGRLSRKERLYGEGANFGGRLHLLDQTGRRIATTTEFEKENKHLHDAHFVAAHTRFLRAFRERITNPIRFVRSDRTDPIAPLIIYYDDTCMFNVVDCGDDAILTLVMTHVNMLGREMIQHLLYNKKITHLRGMDAAFRRALIDYDMTNGGDEEISFVDLFGSLEAAIEAQWATSGIKQRFVRALSLGSLEAIADRRRYAAEIYNNSRRQTDGSSK
jgi:hypothetical protein